MAVKAGDLELDLIDALTNCVAQRLSGEAAAAYTEFVRQYYHWVPAPDLADRNALDLCGAVVAHWKTGQHRPRGEAKVRVYNPDVERDGWHSPFTVIEIVSDDMPFIVDSVTMELSRQGYGIELIVHPVIRVVRDADGELVEVLEPGATASGFINESIIHAEVTRRPDSDHQVLRAGVELVLEEVRVAVEDWAPMRAKTIALATELRRDPPPVNPHELTEIEAFLQWLADDHFTFLGYREYELGGEDPAELRAVPGTGLGILRGASKSPSKRLDDKALELARSPNPLVLTKANSRATVHRRSYLDYVGVKRYGAAGEVIGERRFLGLYTTVAYKTSPREIPLLRGKVERILARAAFPPDSHDAKGLIDILESLPRDLLVQITTDDLFEIAIGILGLGERQRVRLFVSRDRLDRFVFCTLCLPRDRFNTENRERAGKILADAFGGGQLDWRLQRSESVVVRVDYVDPLPRRRGHRLRRGGDRGADRAGDARLERRPPGGPDHQVRGGGGRHPPGAIRLGVPARIPSRLERARCRRGHRSDRRAGAEQAPDHHAVSPPRGRRAGDALQVAERCGGIAVRGPPDVRAHGGQGR